jgi:hydrogenase maturation protein HypF
MIASANAPPSATSAIAARLRLGGRVQGVGYRPFVFRLARQLHIAGSVRNLMGEVEIIAEGGAQALERFARGLLSEAPALAAPQLVSRESIAATGRIDFTILGSSAAAEAHICVPPDLFACEDCLCELADPHDRRHRYPFINCTQCGPRYTLITAMPYDRTNTTMRQFGLCERCQREYATPIDRRFHAEPVACAVCGPHLTLEHEQEMSAGGADTLERVVSLLRSGATVAVKGIGGYHLMCDAQNPAAVSALRARKHRPHKPLAVMFPARGADGLDVVRAHVSVDDVTARSLLSPARPIVLAKRKPPSTLAPQIAPGLDEIGAFLPYSPLHHLLLDAVGGPLVATSGNRTGEPVVTDEGQARLRLGTVADAFLHHNRRIARPADDSVVRVIAGRARPLRLGRGLAPLELPLPGVACEPLLAVGGHLKTAIALAWNGRAVISPHIADMGTVRSLEVFEQLTSDLQRLYGVAATSVVCDAHPRYATTRWAESCGLAITRVLHHHAHASSLVGEHGVIDQPVLVFTWDGTGYGGDGTSWGGETLLGKPGAWHRVASLRPFRLPGGDQVARQPWRSAAAMCWDAAIPWAGNPANELVRQAWERNVHCSVSTAAGRLFDAAAAIVLGVQDTTFEGQGPMLLESRARIVTPDVEPLPIAPGAAGLLRIDWAPLIAALANGGRSIDERAGSVHAVLARTIVEVATRLRQQHQFVAVGLTGGVFQNRKLTQLAAQLLVEAGYDTLLHEQVPCNDGGLSFGQAVEAAAQAAR